MKKSTIYMRLAAAIFVFACVTTVILARQTVGWANLGIMLLALGGLLLLLFLYNRNATK